ncbi:hypothetical protein A3A67_02830 [Candidatus Peribacteria bacterium RIFCSPLOWO2_01_FULL_51_18]|nr:MAG: hypothetical protein A3C52_03445 [Candidatus Peribacteria bacterium RIFCSPHIGHO2_02_FULL_51_15]OGJ66492.1 MAG: hypothetical protein A3A67_02830 [Candidatus Peribacteria bacterium RIFCSPLOWO2_01_FULL_51_18]OGJ69347.1 MAG: hypothetical protein A3J34_01220 [Candidatus Peribacteria bacterium RIFCSPLOWO2_02_FULL_51_10]
MKEIRTFLDRADLDKVSAIEPDLQRRLLGAMRTHATNEEQIKTYPQAAKLFDVANNRREQKIIRPLLRQLEQDADPDTAVLDALCIRDLADLRVLEGMAAVIQFCRRGVQALDKKPMSREQLHSVHQEIETAITRFYQAGTQKALDSLIGTIQESDERIINPGGKIDLAAIAAIKETENLDRDQSIALGIWHRVFSLAEKNRTSFHGILSEP